MDSAVLDDHADLLRMRAKSLAEQYNNLNELAAQAPLAIASMTAGSVPTEDPFEDPFYSNDRIRHDLEKIESQQLKLKVRYQADLRSREASKLAVDEVKQVFQSKKTLKVVSPEGSGSKKTSSGSLRRRKPAANVARRAKMDEVVANTPLSFPVFPGYDHAGRVAPDIIVTEHDEEIVVKMKKKPSAQSNARYGAPKKQKALKSRSPSVSPSVSPNSASTSAPQPNAKIKIGKRRPARPLKNVTNVVTAPEKKPKKKTTKVAFGSGSRADAAKNQIKVAKEKSRKAGGETERIVSTVVRAAEISAAAAGEEILSNRMR